MKPTAITTRL